MTPHEAANLRRAQATACELRARSVERECYDLASLLAEQMLPVPAPDARATCSNFGNLELA